ncbi:MAG TPA: hypothetical protein VN961_08410, partial [Streptosporangiaceae bacterium]|nr:hypothetical protein [Streptosporangiaceae bacterium]
GIRSNLTARIAEAEANHWLGEAEGLRVSLAGATQKLDQMDQITTRRQVTQLGMPAFPDIAGRAVTAPAAIPS